MVNKFLLKNLLFLTIVFADAWKIKSRVVTPGRIAPYAKIVLLKILKRVLKVSKIPVHRIGNRSIFETVYFSSPPFFGLKEGLKHLFETFLI
jgi:hypothetical protein